MSETEKKLLHTVPIPVNGFNKNGSSQRKYTLISVNNGVYTYLYDGTKIDIDTNKAFKYASKLLANGI